MTGTCSIIKYLIFKSKHPNNFLKNESHLLQVRNQKDMGIMVPDLVLCLTICFCLDAC